MSNSLNLELPFVAASQAQKHVTVNESLRRIDAVVQLAVKDRTLNAPPVSPSEGERYIVGPAPDPMSAWAGEAHNIAAYIDGAWIFFVPREGWLSYVMAESALVFFDGQEWHLFDTVGQFGINATADSNNRLVVKAAASLFEADETAAGLEGDVRVLLSKTQAQDTASHLFQTNFSGRAEFGLLGSDDFSIKTSADGSTFNEALKISASDATVSFSKVPQVAGANALSLSLPSATEAALATFDAGVNRLATRGFGAENDGGEAVYHRANQEPAHEGKFQSADGAWWELFAPHGVSAGAFGFVAGADPQDASRALQRACDFLGQSGGVIHLPQGEFTLAPPVETRVAAGEGDCVVLNGAHGAVRIVGRGLATILKPVSNRVVMFSCDGNDSLTLEHIHFDNSAHGILQLTDKPEARSDEPNRGVFGYGNGANAVVRQYNEASVYLRNIRSTRFHTLVFHRGNAANAGILEGIVVAQDVDIYGACQGFLVQQPQRVLLNRVHGADIVQSINSDNSNDPGHVLYVTNRAGATPTLVLSVAITAERVESTPLKANKGELVVFDGCAFDDCAGGFEARNVKRLVIGDSTMRLTGYGGFNNNEGIYIADCGDFSVAGVLIDARETDAWCFNINEDGGTDSYMNKGGSITDVKMLLHTATSGKPAIQLNDWTDTIIARPVVRLFGTGTRANPRFTFSKCTNAMLIDPIVQTPDGSSDDKLVRIDGDCTGVRVQWDDTLSTFTPSSATIENNGTNSKIINKAIEEGSFTPTVSFGTNGNFVPQNVTAEGEWRRRGDWVTVSLRIGFNTNNYTTASDELRIGFDEVGHTPSSALLFWPASIADARKIDFGGEFMSARIAAGDRFITMRNVARGGTGSTITVNHVPPNTTGCLLSFEAHFKRA